MRKTLLLTDIVNSTKLTEQLGDEVMAKIWIEHDHLARELLSGHNGQEADRTDGFLMLFDSVNEASQYAIHLHNAFDDLSKKWEVDFQARIGIHTGDIILIETTEEHRAAGVKHIEVEGIAKPMAARVMSVATGGQTLLSKDAVEAMSTSDNGALKTISHGHWHLKGVAEPMELFEIGNEQTNFHPPADTEKVVRVVKEDDIWIPVKKIPTNLSKESDAFIGRKKELNKLAERVGEEHTRLVTILGPGGTGKTRLSKRFGRMWLGDYPGGVWFCDLVEARSVAGIAAAIASALDTPLAAGDPVEQLSFVLQAKGECLIIVDNFEQVSEFAKETLGVWLEQAPEVKYIATTRNKLNLAGEKTFELSPLPVETDAVSLFVFRAQERKQGFELTDENREDVESIVNELDGMPLSIELAAARVAILKPRQIKEKLKDRFKLLSSKKDVNHRQQTLRATIDWSWDLLEEYEKSALAQCSIFDGGFTLEAAEEIIDLSDYEDAPMTMDVIQDLVDKSLLRSESQRYDIDEPWYGMYVSIHQYCNEKLKKEGAFKDAGEDGYKACGLRHAEYYSKFGSDEAIESYTVNPTIEKLNVVFVEIDNLIAAHSYCIRHQLPSLATTIVKAIFHVLRRIGPYQSIMPIAEATLEIAGIETKDKLDIYIILTEFTCYSFNKEGNEKYLELGLALAKELGDEEREGDLLVQSSRLHLNTDNYEPVLEVLDRMLEIAEKYPKWPMSVAAYQSAGELEHKVSIKNRNDEKLHYYFQKSLERGKEMGQVELWAGVINSYSMFFRIIGDFDKAIDCHKQSIETREQLGNNMYIALGVGALGYTQFEAGDLEEGEKNLLEAIRACKDMGARAFLGGFGVNLSQLYIEQQRFEEANNILIQSNDIFSSIGMSVYQCYSLANLGSVALYQNDFPIARDYFEKAYEIAKGGVSPIALHTIEFWLAEVAGKTGQYETIATEYEKIFKQLEEKQLDSVQIDLLVSWADTAKANDDLETAKNKIELAKQIITQTETPIKGAFKRKLKFFEKRIIGD